MFCRVLDGDCVMRSTKVMLGLPFSLMIIVCVFTMIMQMGPRQHKTNLSYAPEARQEALDPFVAVSNARSKQPKLF